MTKCSFVAIHQRFGVTCCLYLQGEGSGIWVEIHIAVFWVMTPCGIVVVYQHFVETEDGGSKVLRNFILPQHHTASQSRRPRLEFLSKPHSLHPEDGGSMVLRNVTLPQHHTTSQPRRPLLHFSHRS